MSETRLFKRRDFLKKAAAGTALTLTGASACSRRRVRERPPNILVIMSDEHNPTVLGSSGNSIIRTPHLDRLADQGITFTNHYTNSPLCVPCRLSFTAGKYVSRISAWSNSNWLPAADYPSIAHAMNGAGYESFLVGKMHFDPTRRYGFTEIGGTLSNMHKKTGKGNRRDADDTSINTNSRDSRFAEFYTGNQSTILDRDREVTALGSQFLMNRKRSEKPFFMVAGYLAPHFPLIVPENYWKPYKDKIPMPHLPPGHVESQPLNYQHLRKGFGVVETDPNLVKYGRELYYGLTQWLDDEIGQLLEALENSESADNTVVIYTTDHGENMGEHQLWWKNCMYEHSARIPLIIRWQQRWEGGQFRQQACSLVDVVQTILELGNADTPGDWNGHSLCSWMDDAGAGWKDSAVSEYYAHNIASGYVMLRTGQYKYVYHTPPDTHHPAERELYNLQDDPGEFVNLAGDNRFTTVVESLHAQLLNELAEHPDETEQRCRFEYERGYDRS